MDNWEESREWANTDDPLKDKNMKTIPWPGLSGERSSLGRQELVALWLALLLAKARFLT